MTAQQEDTPNRTLHLAPSSEQGLDQPPVHFYNVISARVIAKAGDSAYYDVTVVNADLADPSTDPLALGVVRRGEEWEPRVLWQGRVWKIMDKSILDAVGLVRVNKGSPGINASINEMYSAYAKLVMALSCSPSTARDFLATLLK